MKMTMKMMKEFVQFVIYKSYLFNFIFNLQSFMKRFVEILNEAFSIPELNTYIGNDVITGINDLSLQLDKTIVKLIF